MVIVEDDEWYESTAECWVNHHLIMKISWFVFSETRYLKAKYKILMTQAPDELALSSDQIEQDRHY